MADVYIDLTGKQNLELIGELYGLTKKERKSRAEELLQKFNLLNWKDSLTKKYSKGMKQRLLLCMALMSKPEILFLDEPTTGLDVQSSAIIKELIREYNKAGMTIILTTHDTDVANDLCDRIAIMNKGRIVGLDNPQNLKRVKQDSLAIDIYLKGEVDTQVLEKLPNIKAVYKERERYRLIVEDLKLAITEIMSYINENKLQLEKLNTYEPELEEVFLKMINGEYNK